MKLPKAEGSLTLQVILSVVGGLVAVSSPLRLTPSILSHCCHVVIYITIVKIIIITAALKMHSFSFWPHHIITL